MIAGTALALAVVALSLPGALPGGEDAVAKTRSMVEAFKDVRKPKEGTSPTEADRSHNKAAFAVLDGFFDFDTFVANVASPHKGKFSEAQYASYRTLFKDVVRAVAYPDSGDFFRKAKITLKQSQSRTSPEDVVMDAVVEEEDIDTQVVFHWSSSKDGLRVTDVSFEGASLVKDYQNQFGRIIEKEGVAGLIRKLENKLKERRDAGAIP